MRASAVMRQRVRRVMGMNWLYQVSAHGPGHATPIWSATSKATITLMSGGFCTSGVTSRNEFMPYRIR